MPRSDAHSYADLGVFQIPFLANTAFRLFQGKIAESMRAQGRRAHDGELGIADLEGAAINAMNQYRQLARDLPKLVREKMAPTAVPVLIIAGDEDRFLEPPSPGEFSDLAARFTVQVVKGKHWIHHEKPELVNRLLREFWEASCS